MDRMRVLAETAPALMKAIGISVTDRSEATERIYNRHNLKAVKRQRLPQRLLEAREMAFPPESLAKFDR